jgi:quercetin dioxygenase-like cupin family protein
MMRRILLAVAASVVIGAGGLALATQGDHGRRTARRLSERDVIEKLDGKDARVTTLELSLEPGASGRPHRHPGPVFGYVIEGEFELGLDDQPVKRLRAGETFYEPGGALHRVSRNPSERARARVLAVMLHPRDAKELVLPAAKE